MLGHRSNQKTFSDEIVGYYLPDNHFLKVNDIINRLGLTVIEPLDA